MFQRSENDQTLSSPLYGNTTHLLAFVLRPLCAGCRPGEIAFAYRRKIAVLKSQSNFLARLEMPLREGDGGSLLLASASGPNLPWYISF